MSAFQHKFAMPAYKNPIMLGMQFVEMLVADATYHGSGPLTYGSSEPLAPGVIVTVPLQKRKALAVALRHVSKPSFAVKPVLAISKLSPIPAPLLALLEWLQDYYPAPLGILTQLLFPKSLPAKPLSIDPLPAVINNLPELTPDQIQALGQIKSAGLHILHGETGTGKTRVYIELTAQAIAKNQSAIILTPEIGLTSQLAADFEAVFGKRVIVVHSKLTEATKQRLWQYVLEQPEPLIIIGPRSALFYPVRSLGLIAVDESHETAYKQDQAPYYHTTTVAGKLAGLHGAKLVLGSATPLVADYYIAHAKERPIIRMTRTATSTTEMRASAEIIDLRDRKKFSRSSYLSDALLAAVAQSMQQGEQSLLFLNRRGTARVIFCEQCGWQADCPHCDLPLVYHGDAHRMRCHSCNFSASVPSSCPECRNASIVFKVIGTKAITEEIARIFPEARVMRFDTDNTKDERIEQHYDALRDGRIQILVGTQTLAKGLDLPKLSVVGVIIADTSLYFPDFSAKERTYQLLVQVLGRVGRGHTAGSVVIQTYMPDNPLLKAAVDKDWVNFYEGELAERKLFTFPPYCYLLKLTCRRATSVSAARTAQELANKLHSTHQKILIEGPTPGFHEKSQNKFAWQLIIKTKERSKLTQIIRSLPSGWSYDIDPMNLL